MTARRSETENDSLAKQDYLWDGSGTPDPEVQKLEALLGTFRHDRPAPVFPALAPTRRWMLFPPGLVPGLATTAGAIALAIAMFLALGHWQIFSRAGWDISRASGTPRIERQIIGGSNKRFSVGQFLETDNQSRVSLWSAATGWIDVDPGSRLRLLSMGASLNRIALDRGTIHALIWATPGQFVVDTPSAMTVDLGCAYTLHVDDSGAGLVRTTRGWVGFKLNGREAFIPAGAADATRPKIGPGTPYFEDASPQLRASLEKFDFEDNTPEARTADLAIVLKTSRRQDALTLWHLLTRADETQRLLVYHRLQQLVPSPAGVTKDGVMQLDQSMLDQWWNQLGFDDIAIWRHWERNWSETSARAKGDSQ
jgi:hypothetical protein